MLTNMKLFRTQSRSKKLQMQVLIYKSIKQTDNSKLVHILFTKDFLMLSVPGDRLAYSLRFLAEDPLL